MSDNSVYAIPARFRRIENLHILLWLIKDSFWALNLRVPGMIMIIPTLAVALYITWQTRQILSELLHNLAVVFWITANCMWMTGEFFGWDDKIGTGYGLRQYALIPFSLGLLVLGYYYIILAPSKSFREKMFEKSEEIIEKEVKSEDKNSPRP